MELHVPQTAAHGGVGVGTMEAVASLGFMAAGAAAIWDSLRLGAGWAADGPQTGYFPFWIGLLLVTASAINLVGVALAARPRGGELRGRAAPLFLSWEQLRTVATVFVPTAIYVAAIPFIGLYVASALLVAWFMWRLGGFGPLRATASGVATALVAFAVFEIWFLVALPKGPLEELLGY
ncbi:tricarboxylate transporter [Falsiroseomonas bella]|uniref:Tricarboxylate transporter n=2 Tax=Falsiroseomonas bella TaxID=2184016 RepID=A0A317FEQ9_9PROT|nr:tricarboxylate transporter [Falsiroseomonas bella]